MICVYLLFLIRFWRWNWNNHRSIFIFLVSHELYIYNAFQQNTSHLLKFGKNIYNILDAYNITLTRDQKDLDLLLNPPTCCKWCIQDTWYRSYIENFLFGLLHRELFVWCSSCFWNSCYTCMIFIAHSLNLCFENTISVHMVVFGVCNKD